MLGKLYSSFGVTSRNKYNWSETNGIMSWNNATNYREPDIVTSYDTDRYLANYLSGQTESEMLAKEMEENFAKMIKSIKKYGGFYIGRYETGGLSSTNRQNAVVRKMNTSIASTHWFAMYEACKNLSGTNENVTTSMIWGSLWDETLNWLVNSGAKNSEGTILNNSLITSNSVTWGNYINASFNYIEDKGEKTVPIETKFKAAGSTRIPTGSTEYTKVNNIYDLAGNVWDWTLEAVYASIRVCRGGGYYSTGSGYPASYRYGNYGPDYSNGYGRLSCSTFNKLGILNGCVLIHTKKSRKLY